MAVGSQQRAEPAENWDDDFDFESPTDERGTKPAAPFSSRLLRTTTRGQAHMTSTVHRDPFLSLDALASSHLDASGVETKQSTPSEEEDWDVELKISSSAPGKSNLPFDTVPLELQPRQEAKQGDSEIENWDDDFVDPGSPQKSSSSRDKSPPLPMDRGEASEVWDDEEPVTSMAPATSTHQPDSRIPLHQQQTNIHMSRPEKDEFGLIFHHTSDDDGEDHTITARQRRKHSSSGSPQLSSTASAHVLGRLPFPQGPLDPSSSSSSHFPPTALTRNPPASPVASSSLHTYARSPSAMSGSSAGSSSNLHGHAFYGSGSHTQLSTGRSPALGYTSASVFSLPNTLHSHTSHGSTVPLNSANGSRPSAPLMTPTSNRLRKQPGGRGAGGGFAQLPPSPLVHKERERRRLRKKSRPSVGNTREVFVVAEDISGREDIESYYDHPYSDQMGHTDTELQEPSESAHAAAYPGPRLDTQESEELASQMQPLPQTPRRQRMGLRSVSAGPEGEVSEDPAGNSGTGLLGRIGSVKRWAKAKRRRGSTAPQDVQVSESDRVTDGDISASDFSEQHPQRDFTVLPDHVAAQRTPRPRSSMSSFLNASRNGSPSPSPGSPSRWPNIFRNEKFSSPKAEKGRRRMTMAATTGTPTPTRPRTNTITRESFENNTSHRRSSSQSRSRGAQVYGSALSAARASERSLALNGSKTSLSSVKEQDSPLPRSRRKSFGRLITDRIPSALKTPRKSSVAENTERQPERFQPAATVRRISLANTRGRSPIGSSGKPGNRDDHSSARAGLPSSSSNVTPTGPRIRSRSRTYDLGDAPPVPELPGPYYGILRSTESNSSQQSLSLERQQSRASSSASHLPMAPSSWKRTSTRMDARVPSSQYVRDSIEPPGKRLLLGTITSSDLGAKLKELGNAPELPTASEPAIELSGHPSHPAKDLGARPAPSSLLPPIELHPPSPPQTLGVSAFQPAKRDARGPEPKGAAPSAGVLNTFQESQGSDLSNSATTSTSSLFYTPSSSPNAKKRGVVLFGLSASPHSPPKAASLGRTTGPIVGSDTASGTINPDGSSQIKSSLPRRNSLGDLKIPTRISQAQGNIRRDLGLVKEFASRIGELKDLKVAYLSLLQLLEAKVASLQSTRRSNVATASALMNLFNEAPSPVTTEPGRDSDLAKDLQARVNRIQTLYDISWECAELLIDLGGGPTAEGETASIASPELNATYAGAPDFSSQTSSQVIHQTSGPPPSSRTSHELPTSTPAIVPKKSRERAITLSSTTSAQPSGAPHAVVAHYAQLGPRPANTLPNSPSDAPPSTGRRDLSQRQLLLLREILNSQTYTNDGSQTTEAASNQLPEKGNELTSILMDSAIETTPNFAYPRETPVSAVLGRRAASSTVELPLGKPDNLSNSGGKESEPRVTSHRRQWSRGGLSKTLQNASADVPSQVDQEPLPKRKGMQAIRDMLRALKFGRTEGHASSQLPPPPVQPTSGSPLVSPTPSNYVDGAAASRLGVSSTQSGMHSTSSLSSAVSHSSYGSRQRTPAYDSARTISGGPVPNASLGRAEHNSSWAAGHVTGTYQMPQGMKQSNSKATKSGPRRPSLASLFRVGRQQSGEGKDVGPGTFVGTSRSGNSSASVRVQQRSVHPATFRNEDHRVEAEDDWDRIDSASDIDSNSIHSRKTDIHNVTIRGQPGQHRISSKGQSSTNPSIPPPEAPRQHTLHVSPHSTTINASSTSLIGSSGLKDQKLAHPNTPNEKTMSRTSLSNYTHRGEPHVTSSQSHTNPSTLCVEAKTVRPSFIAEMSPRSPDFGDTFQSNRATEHAPEESSSTSPAGFGSRFSTSTQISNNALYSRRRAPGLALADSKTRLATPDSDASYPTPGTTAVHSGISLSMTPENIRPLLANAKEVQERLAECIRDLTALLHVDSSFPTAVAPT